LSKYDASFDREGISAQVSGGPGCSSSIVHSNVGEVVRKASFHVGAQGGRQGATGADRAANGDWRPCGRARARQGPHINMKPARWRHAMRRARRRPGV